MAECPTCGAPVNLAPDGDPHYEPPAAIPAPAGALDAASPRTFEGIDWSRGRDHGYHVVTIGPDATPEDVQAFRDAYALGSAWAEAEAALPEGWHIEAVTRAAIYGDVSENAHPGGKPIGDEWIAAAQRNRPNGTWERCCAEGTGMPEALRALAARLRSEGKP